MAHPNSSTLNKGGGTGRAPWRFFGRISGFKKPLDKVRQQYYRLHARNDAERWCH
jgi:hypothetical protein